MRGLVPAKKITDYYKNNGFGLASPECPGNGVVPKIEHKVRQKTCKQKTTETSLLAHNKGENHPLVRPQV